MQRRLWILIAGCGLLCAATPVVRALVSGDGAGGTIKIDRDVTLSVANLPKGGTSPTHPLSHGRVAFCYVAKGTVTLSRASLARRRCRDVGARA